MLGNKVDLVLIDEHYKSHDWEWRDSSHHDFVCKKCSVGDNSVEANMPCTGSKTKNTTKSYAEDLIFRLQERARIRRQIPTRKSVQEGKPDRISDLLEEAAVFIQLLKDKV